MIKFFKNFSKDDSGAVTVDWVVLTAAVVGLAIAAYGTIRTQTMSLAGQIETAIENVEMDPGEGDGET